jgi:hypothetical protein
MRPASVNSTRRQTRSNSFVLYRASQATALAMDDASFRACVDKEAKAAVRRAFKKIGPVDMMTIRAAESIVIFGHHVDIKNAVISACNQQLVPESEQEVVYTTDRSYSYVNSVVDADVKTALDKKIKEGVEAQRKRDELEAPRLKAEKDAEKAAGSAYCVCLVRHARVLAQHSIEPAETIAQATFPSCSNERQVASDVYHQHNNPFSEVAMDAMEQKLRQGLLLEIIKTRAVPADPAPATIKPDSSI